MGMVRDCVWIIGVIKIFLNQIVVMITQLYKHTKETHQSFKVLILLYFYYILIFKKIIKYH